MDSHWIIEECRRDSPIVYDDKEQKVIRFQAITVDDMVLKFEWQQGGLHVGDGNVALTVVLIGVWQYDN